MIFSPKVNALSKPLKGVISRKRMMLQSASEAPKGVLREGIAPAFWALSGVDIVSECSEWDAV